MKELKFTATKKMIRYNGVVSFGDGDTQPLKDAEADRLLEMWPENFSVVTTRSNGPDKDEKSHHPKKNKLFRSSKDK